METATAVASNDAVSKKRCRLLELPAELRNRIYEYGLTSQEESEIWIDREVRKVYRSAHKIRFPALIQASRQLRAETLGIWYSNLTLLWYWPVSLITFGYFVGIKHFSMIPRILDPCCWGGRKRAVKYNYRNHTKQLAPAELCFAALTACYEQDGVRLMTSESIDWSEEEIATEKVYSILGIGI